MVALAGYAIIRRIGPGRIDQRAEEAIDDLPDGLTARRPTDREQFNMTGRLRRVIRFGADGPGIEIDAAAYGRVRFRRVASS